MAQQGMQAIGDGSSQQLTRQQLEAASISVSTGEDQRRLGEPLAYLPVAHQASLAASSAGALAPSKRSRQEDSQEEECLEWMGWGIPSYASISEKVAF